MSAVILQEEIVHYEVLGRGRPVIFLHGWVGSWRYWIPTMQAASVSFRAYAIDMWGFGDTAKNPERYSIEQQVSLVGEFMERMGILKAAVVGHGLGATVALQFSKRHSEFVDRVMAVSFPTGDGTINPRLKASTPVELADWLLGRVPGSEAARIEAPKADGKAILASLEEFPECDLPSLSMELSTPCLYVHGQNDPAVALPRFEDLYSLPDHTHHILFEQSGHFPMLDETSKFNRLLADFLALPSGTTPRQLQLKEEWKRRVR